MSAKKLSKKEMERVEELVARLNESEEALDQQLEAQFGEEAPAIREGLESGVDKFYELFRGELKENALYEKLNENLKGLSMAQKYTYLANIMLALTQVCGTMVEGPEWKEELEGHRAILEALESGALEEGDSRIVEGIDHMLALIEQEADAFAVLLIGDAPYEELLDACLTENPSVVEALAANTRSMAVNMAAAIYILKDLGELPYLGEERIAPEDMGVLSASLLEMDAASKSGSFEFAKKVIEKASRAAVTLLVASPSLLADAVGITLLLYLLTSFSALWMLVGGVVLLINAKIHVRQAKEQVDPILQKGAELLHTTLDKAKEVWNSFRSWVHSDVMPKAIPVWQRFRDYTVNKLILPVAAWILRGAAKVSDAAHSALENVKAYAERMKERAGHFADEAKSYGKDPEEEVDIEEEIEIVEETDLEEDLEEDEPVEDELKEEQEEELEEEQKEELEEDV